jgi:5-methyltetrahydropteroyltriglutamate--homocysteine methyltransferase
MQGTEQRILTTHAGSLPRPDDMLVLLRDKAQGREVDEQEFEAVASRATRQIVSQQTEHGIDVVDDGEVSKTSFVGYITERLGGLELVPGAASRGSFSGSRDERMFPGYYAWERQQQDLLRQSRDTPSVANLGGRWTCTGPITYTGHAQVQRDIANLTAAMDSTAAVAAFLPAISPSNAQFWLANAFYATEDEYQLAIADALHEEYKAITDAGLLVQVDDPQLVTYYMRNPDATIEECRRWARRHVEVLKHALRGIPRERVRFHTCYSINVAPRVSDMELKDIIDIILQVHAGGFSFEFANPRHEHEWRLFDDFRLPDDAVLIPGVITQSNVLVEHPRLVADRIERFASVVGREQVVAGADCGSARSLE